MADTNVGITAWDVATRPGQPAAEHLARLHVDPGGLAMTGVGSYVLDVHAKRAEETGSGFGVGMEGLVWNVADHVDQETGELRPVLQVATRHHGQLGFADLALSKVADAWPCGKVDAQYYITLCQRTIARAPKGKVDPRVVEVLALATGIKQSGSTPGLGRLQREQLPAPTVERVSPGGLADLMAVSTAAHVARNDERTAS